MLIDLHGAPGSQNGFDNSGERLPAPTWQQGDTVQRTLDVLATIQSKYGDSSYDDVVAGIELLNEPLSSELNLSELKQFERDGYNQQRTYSDSRVVVVQDGFQAPSSYNGFLSSSDNNSQNVAIDHHEYQVFTDELVALLPWQHRQYVCNNAGTYSGADKWTFVGEWTAAMTDCAAALNGTQRHHRHHHHFAHDHVLILCRLRHRRALRRHISRQQLRGQLREHKLHRRVGPNSQRRHACLH